VAANDLIEINSIDIADSLLQGVCPSTLVVWFSEQDSGCVAEVRCPVMNFFCEDAHLQAWHITTPQQSGIEMNILEALEVGRATFSTLLT
jgi:alkylmercury lyase